MFKSLLVIAFCLLNIPIFSQVATTPILRGYVNQITSSSDFQVNGQHVHCTPSTMNATVSGLHIHSTSSSCQERIFGEHLNIYGKRHKSVIEADTIEAEGFLQGHQSGFAIVDHIYQTSPLQIRADGYAIHFSAKTEMTLPSGMTVIDLKPGIWITYSGSWTDDGVLLADRASFSTGTLSKHQEKTIDRTAYDPATVTQKDKQNAASKLLLGIDPRRVPPYDNADMQKRVQTLGKRLVPAFYSKFSDDDPQKIEFHFQVIDDRGVPSTYAFPSGVILIPRKTVEQISDDTHLSVILADAIASVMVRQQLRSPSLDFGLSPAGDTAAILLAPIGGLVGWGTYALIENPKNSALQQSTDRCSLALLHDAGYDVKQAPIAWWTLHAGKKDLTKVSPPSRSAYLFEVLAQHWGPNSPLLTTSNTAPHESTALARPNFITIEETPGAPFIAQ